MRPPLPNGRVSGLCGAIEARPWRNGQQHEYSPFNGNRLPPCLLPLQSKAAIGRISMTKFSRRDVLRLSAGAAMLPAFPGLAHAQAYPTRIARLVVGFPPGGGADAVSRIIASR